MGQTEIIERIKEHVLEIKKLMANMTEKDVATIVVGKDAGVIRMRMDSTDNVTTFSTLKSGEWKEY